MKSFRDILKSLPESRQIKIAEDSLQILSEIHEDVVKDLEQEIERLQALINPERQPKAYDIWERTCGTKIWLIRPTKEANGWHAFEGMCRYWENDLVKFVTHTTDIREALEIIGTGD